MLDWRVHHGGAAVQYFKHYRDHFGTSSSRFYKTTLFESPHLLVGLNCLEPGQAQALHAHAGQDKIYLVLEGEGTFTVGGQRQVAGEGVTVWAPGGVEHGVENTGPSSLVLFVGIAPAASG
jgi:quercetin dioxygenase-like cupin family protein